MTLPFSRLQRTALRATLLMSLLGFPVSAQAQPLDAPGKPAAKLSAARTPARATVLRATTSSARGAAWALPDANALVERVYARIVAQDKPGAVPIREYQRRFVGRDATLEAVRRFAGHPVELASSAFNAVDGWTDAPKLDVPLCEGPGCPAPINSIWLAITRIERGELPHELHVWYTTSFAAESPSGPTRQTYAFCERWLRVGGGWKYDGFVRVSSSSDKSE